MKKRSGGVQAGSRTASSAAPEPARTSLWRWFFIAICLGCLIAYLPAVRGPFLFDDRSLMPFFESPPSLRNLLERLARLVTNLSLLAESRLAGTNPAAFHLTNIAIHLLNGFLVWRILEELLARHGERSAGDRMAALAGAGLYLLHPLQTEAVAYISSRSEVLCAMFAYLAFRVFLGSSPDQPMTWRRAIAATVLIGLSALSKEPGVAMAGVFVVHDLTFTEKPRLRPLLQRWRLYAPLLAAAVILGTRLFLTLSREGTAGVSARHKPLDYLLTQFEVIWRYFRLVILPFGQNLDHAYPVVQWPGTLWTWTGLLALGMLAAAFWRLRPRYPIAFFGFAFLLILLAPTSSIVPIDDAMAERRLYLGSPGIAMIAADFLRRLQPFWKTGAALAAVLLSLCGLTAQRADLYTSAVSMWENSTRVNPRNGRAWFHLAFAYYEQGRCVESVRAYERAAQERRPDYELLVDWALALQCAGQLDEAIAQLERAKKLERHSHAWVVEGRILAQKGDLEGALKALNEALHINPADPNAYSYRGNVHMLRRDPAAALADYEQALRLNPGDTAALKGRQAALAALARSR
ncbi:MAG: tetratricopeptide repeat protein [Bryobacteraceae bacterium]